METNEHYSLNPTTWWTLLALFIVSGVTAFFVIDTWLSYGYAPVLIPIYTFIVPALMSVFVLWEAWKVRSYRMGNRPLNMLSAARIWLLAQAASRTGAVMAGVCAGATASYMSYLHSDVMVYQAIAVGIAGAVSVGMSVAGFIAELWCKNDDDDESVPPATAV
ncbi:DUF3180 domain-containing protein [Arcanobacterium phocisimile]|uniref:DUF3180 domain-containing protein n=1 Tax=Arcanobacterium phocisimile TaxID=1302235 RepID=A0ABX7IH23_9ACTO|nr:DUF3180 domain-containing protein [Arcanobacterium phocisimile]QRV02419.1 DUF3180 domain-containing protein [Arcanobacterium phocisimile]